MFERKFLDAGDVQDAPQRDYATDGLRPVAWDEIVALLGAGHDFRRVLKDERGIGEGSFDGPSASRLAALEEGQRGINPFALTNRRMAHSKDEAAGSEAPVGDRGRT